MPIALLLIDVQNPLLHGQWSVVDVEPVAAKINLVAARLRSSGGLVVFVQQEEDHKAMRFGPEGWRLYRGLEVREEDRSVRKTACGSFFRTDLKAILEKFFNSAAKSHRLA